MNTPASSGPLGQIPIDSQQSQIEAFFLQHAERQSSAPCFGLWSSLALVTLFEGAPLVYIK